MLYPLKVNCLICSSEKNGEFLYLYGNLEIDFIRFNNSFLNFQAAIGLSLAIKSI